jgi:hypothetical protein
MVRRLRRFLELPRADRRLLLTSAVLVPATRVGLWVLPFTTVRGLLGRLAPEPPPSSSGGHPVQRIRRAISLVSRYVPGASCLTRALSAQALLRRDGHPASLHIGVAREDDGQLVAHAWVESNGRVVIGGSPVRLRRYTALGTMEAERR